MTHNAFDSSVRILLSRNGFRCSFTIRVHPDPSLGALLPLNDNQRKCLLGLQHISASWSRLAFLHDYRVACPRTGRTAYHSLVLRSTITGLEVGQPGIYLVITLIDVRKEDDVWILPDSPTTVWQKGPFSRSIRPSMAFFPPSWRRRRWLRNDLVGWTSCFGSERKDRSQIRICSEGHVFLVCNDLFLGHVVVPLGLHDDDRVLLVDKILTQFNTLTSRSISNENELGSFIFYGKLILKKLKSCKHQRGGARFWGLL